MPAKAMSLPQPSGEFRWTQEGWGVALRCSPLFECATHVFTTRTLVLKGAPGETAAGWAEAAAAVGVTADQLVRLRQVHGARVVEAVRGAGTVSHEDWPEADVSIKIGNVPMEIVHAQGRTIKTVRIFRPVEPAENPEPSGV